MTQEERKDTAQKGVAVSSEAEYAPGTSSSYSIEIIPEKADQNSVLILRPTGFSASDAEIQWYLNGSLAQSASGPALSAKMAKRGDQVYARAVINNVELSSNTVAIGNTPPEIVEAKLLPEVFRPGDTLRVAVRGVDADEDEVLYLYEWTLNNEQVSADDRIGVPVKRGDMITVQITPYDGEDNGMPVFARREIANMPPTIIEKRDFSFDGKIYTSGISAVDPDGDKLVYSIESGTEGIVINSETGAITWSVPADFTGKADILVSVSDEFGGKATQALSFNVSVPDPERPPGE